jgi:hypothetical protein
MFRVRAGSGTGAVSQIYSVRRAGAERNIYSTATLKTNSFLKLNTVEIFLFEPGEGERSLASFTVHCLILSVV